MKAYTVTVQQTYLVMAKDEDDAASSVEAVYDRATEGQAEVRFDDDTRAALQESDTIEVKEAEDTDSLGQPI